MNPNQAIKLIINSVVDSLKANPAGTPEGSLYAVMMTQGCTIVQFRAIVTALLMPE